VKIVRRAIRVLSRCVAIMACFALAETPTFATCVIVVKVRNQVVVGADSFRTNEMSGQTTQACKILKIGHLVFTASGQTLSPYHDVYGLVKKLYETNGDVAELFIMFNTSVLPPLKKAVENVRDHSSPELFQRVVKGDALQAVFIDVSGESPRLFSSYFRLKLVDGRIDIYAEPHADSGAEDFELHRLGEHAAIDSLTRNYFDRPDIVAPVRAAIDTQMKATPKSVGGPIAIMLISGSSVQWVEKSKPCKDQE